MVLPDEELQLLRSGAQPFICNQCTTVFGEARPSDAPDDSSVSPGILASAPHAAPAASPLIVPEDGATGLRELLLGALQGISFLTDSVAELRESNDRLRRENARALSQQADTIASLRSEVRRLRDELSSRVVSARHPLTPPTTPDPKLAACAQLGDSASTSVATTPLPPSALLPQSQPPAPTSATPSPAPSQLTPSRGKTPPSDESTKSKNPAFVGASAMTGLVVVNPPKRPKPAHKVMLVSKLCPSPTAEQLQAHLSSVSVAPLFCRRLRTRYNTYASFCVGVDDQGFQRLTDPCMWPADCLFKPFRGKLYPDMILSPNQTHRDDKKER